MITKSHDTAQNLCLVTFSIQTPAKVRHVSVCGDFNSWTAGAHPLLATGDGKFSATIPLPAGQRFAFKYLCDHGDWHNDDAADEYAPNEYGVFNSIVSTAAPEAKAKPVAKAPAKKAAAKEPVAKKAPAAKKAAAKEAAPKEPAAKKAPVKKKAAKKTPGTAE